MTIINRSTLAKFLLNFLEKYLKPASNQFTLDEIETMIELPPQEINATYAFPCYKLAKVKKNNPQKIAEEIKEQIKIPDFLENVEARGAYLNFTGNKELVLKNIMEAGENYGLLGNNLNRQQKKPLKIVIEYPAPNTNKPLHLGHVRNMLIGSTLAKLLRYLGHQVFEVNLYNDRGVHICKSMLAYKKCGNGAEPGKIKSDHFVGDFYVKYAELEKESKDLEDELRSLLKAWEENEPEARQLWEKLNKWALDGFRETFEKFEIHFDKEYHESEFYEKGKELILKGLEKGIFRKREDGAIIAPLKEKYDLPDKVLLRADGTSIYVTQDIYLAYLKKKDFNYDKSIYVVGNEQNLYFKQLFTILDLLGFKEDKYHLSYGMIYLPEGKMKSREGTVVDADDLVEEMEKLAIKEIEERYPDLTEKEKKQRASIIGMAALRFFILKFNPKSDFTFDPNESISFEGETGPYIQYCYARIESIIRKSKETISTCSNLTVLTHEKERSLINKLTYFPEIIERAAKSYELHLIPQYLLNLCQDFNSFYAVCPVISEEKELEKARLVLIRCVQIIIEIGLNLLGIKTLKEM
ncbi:MAG: arginine--tRNA ligase [Promethearchaeota archaeon]